MSEGGGTLPAGRSAPSPSGGDASTDVAAAAVGGAARRSLLLSFMGRYGAMPLRLAAMLALARLLTPEEFGAYASALAVVQLCAVLTDIGATQYLVQAPAAANEPARRAAFGLGLALGGGAAVPLLAIGLLAPPAWLDSGVGTTLAVFSLTLLLQPAVAVLSAGLHRELRFGPIAVAGVAGAATLAGGSVALAALGFGPVGLAIAGVAELLVVATVLRLHGRAVLPRPSLRGWRPVFGFGWVWGAIGGLRQGADAVSRLLVGTALGLGPLGLLSRAQAVTQIFDKALLDAVSPVVLPALAAAQRAGRPIGPVYLRQVACFAAVAWPFFGALALLAEPFIRLLLGPGWDGAVPIVRWLCLAGLFLPLSGLVLPYLIAVGRLRAWLPAQVAIQAGRVALVALAATVFLSIELVAVALAAEGAAKALAAQRLLGRYLELKAGATARVLLRSALPSLTALGAVLAVVALPVLRDAPPWMLLSAAALAALPVWLLALIAVRHPLHEEIARLRAGLLARLERYRAPRARSPQPATPSPGRLP